MYHRKKSFLKGLLVDSLGTPLTMLIGIVFTPLYFIYINKSDFGYWTTVLDLMGFLNILNAGVGIYLVQIISRERTNGIDQTKRAFNSLVLVQFVILLIMLLVSLTIYLVFPSFRANGEGIANSEWIYALMIVNLLINTLWSLLNQIMFGQNRISTSNGLTLLQKTLTQVTPLLLLVLGFGLISFPISYVATSTLMLIVTISITIPFLKKHLARKSINRAELKEFSIFSLRSLFGGASYYVLNFTDTIIIANFISSEKVTIYTLTMKLCNFTRFIPARILGLAFPSVAQLVAEKDYAKLHEISLKFFRFSLRVGFVTGTLVILLNRIFVEHWVGLDKYGGDLLSYLFAILCFRESFFVIFFNIIYSTKDIKTITKINFVEAILNIILSIVFLHFWGITGVALATVVASCIFSTIYSWYKASKIIKLPVYKFLSSIKIVGIRFIPTAVVLIIGTQLLTKHFTWILFISILVCAGIINTLCFEGITLLKYRKLPIKELIFKIIDDA